MTACITLVLKDNGEAIFTSCDEEYTIKDKESVDIKIGDKTMRFSLEVIPDRVPSSTTWGSNITYGKFDLDNDDNNAGVIYGQVQL